MSIENFLIEQIESEINSIEYLLNFWKNPTEHQRHILTILIGKSYGYLNTLKELMKR